MIKPNFAVVLPPIHLCISKAVLTHYNMSTQGDIDLGGEEQGDPTEAGAGEQPELGSGVHHASATSLEADVQLYQSGYNDR